MKKLLLLFLIFLNVVFDFPARAQLQGQALIDSLLIELPKAKDDTNKVKILNDLSYAYFRINPNEGIKAGEQALALAMQLGWKKGMAAANSSLGNNYKTGRSDYPRGLEYFLKALKISEEIDDKKGIAGSYANIGSIYREQRDLDKSLEYMEKSLNLYRELGDKSGIALNLGNIGNGYINMQDYSKGEEYLNKALKIYEEINDKKGIARNLENLGGVKMDIGDMSTALECYHKSLAINKELGNKNGIAQNFGNLGDVHYYIATDTSALTVKLLQKRFSGSKMAALQTAGIYTDSAITLGKEIDYQNGLYVNYYLLSDIQVEMGDYKGALESFKNCFHTKEAIFNKEKDKKLTQAAMQYEFDKKEAAAQAEQERKNLITYIISIALIFVLIIALVTYRSLKRNQKQKEIISAQKEKVEKQNAEKETLLKEIHHRVKNNLQVISSLLELQSGGVEDESAKAALSEGQNRVKSIALIHQKLYQHENLAAIELKNFMNELYRQVATVFIKKDQVIETHFSIPETYVDIDTAVPLGLILNELLTNSFKYAFEFSKKNELNVDLVSYDNGKYVLKYYDTGKGLPAETDLNKSRSLGLRLISRLSKQIGGKAEYHFDNGSIFTINFMNTIARMQ